MARIAIYKDYATRSLGKSTAVIEFRTSSKFHVKVFNVVVIVNVDVNTNVVVVVVDDDMFINFLIFFRGLLPSK